LVAFWGHPAAGFQGASKGELALEEKRAKDILDHAKRRIEDRRHGEALKLLVELHKTYPSSVADEEGQKLLPDVKKKANVQAEALLTEAETELKAKKHLSAEKKLNELIEGYPNTDCFEKAEIRLKEVQKSVANERDAEAGLKLIRPWASDSNRHAAFRLQANAIIKKFPETKAAAEARTMLKDLP